MRTGANIVPTFWTRGSGKKLRGDPAAQVLAVYFMTSPSSSMIGLYYLPRTTLLHDTGLSEEELQRALPKVREIALYDEQEQLVYLPEGASHQIGKVLTTNDKKRKSILNQLRVYDNHPFVAEWIRRYHAPYQLAHDGIGCPGVSPAPPNSPPKEAPSKPLRSPFEGASGYPDAPDPDPRSDPDPDPDPREHVGATSPVEPIPLVADLQARARTWVLDALKGGLVYPAPERWTETLELRDLVAATFRIEPDTLAGVDRHGRPDGRVMFLLERWAEGTPQARMRQAVRGAAQDDLISRKTQLQSLQTIFKDANAVDKYARLAKSKEPAPGSKANVERVNADAVEARRKFRAREGM